MSPVQIIGIGNPDRCDDGAGPAVIAALDAAFAGAPPPGVTLATARGDMLALLDLWADHDHVLLVDAMAPDHAPGRIVRIDAGTGPVTRELGGFASTHAFDLAETIELARALGRLPGTLIVYGIEGACFNTGQSLSPVVSNAIDGVVAQLLEECRPCTKLH